MSGIPYNWEANKHAAPTLILGGLDSQSKPASSAEDLNGLRPESELHETREEWASEIQLNR